MNIDELTLKQIREIQAMGEGHAPIGEAHSRSVTRSCIAL